MNILAHVLHSAFRHKINTLLRFIRIAATAFGVLAILGSQSLVSAAHAGGDSHKAHSKERGAKQIMGKARPFQYNEVRNSRLRRSLDKLPAKKRQRALDNLHRFSFPESDLDMLESDSEGAIFYVDEATRRDASEIPLNSEITQFAESFDADSVFTLHSRPGAANVIYLDFNGGRISGTAWNVDNATLLFAEPYDADGNPSIISNEELQNIAEIWHRVAEDFSAFDVDVTTEEPLFFTPRTGRVLITQSTDAMGAKLPASTAGGAAYVGVFNTNFYDYYSPAMVYADNLADGFAPYVAEAATHEMGHYLGLGHDGNMESAYQGLLGTGEVSWAPIMGVGYNAAVTQWSRGEYQNASNLEDDIEIIQLQLGNALDDHGDALASSSLLSIDEAGQVFSTTPETDLAAFFAQNKGVIDWDDDRDLFLINAADGVIDLTVTPAWAAWDRGPSGRGANLDISLRLLDVLGNVIATDNPQDRTDARINMAVTAGTYYLEVSGGDNNVTPYTRYGSHGMYFIDGVIEAVVGDRIPPTPNPMTFLLQPTTIDSYSVTMEAIEAIDESGSAVEYYFSCSSEITSCADSGWMSSRSWVATGLLPEIAYNFAVKARDASGNETGFSTLFTAVTEPEILLPSTPEAPEPPELMAASVENRTVSMQWADNSDTELGFRIVRQSWKARRDGWKRERVAAELDADMTSFSERRRPGRYRIETFNAEGNTTSEWIEVQVTR